MELPEKAEALIIALYQNSWLSGDADPTGGSIYFSMQNNLAQDRGWGRIPKNLSELHFGSLNSLKDHASTNEDFVYLIAEPIDWGVLIMGNHGCIYYGSCR